MSTSPSTAWTRPTGAATRWLPPVMTGRSPSQSALWVSQWNKQKAEAFFVQFDSSYFLCKTTSEQPFSCFRSFVLSSYLLSEPGKVEYSLRAKTLPSEIQMCASSPPTGSTSTTRSAWIVHKTTGKKDWNWKKKMEWHISENRMQVSFKIKNFNSFKIRVLLLMTFKVFIKVILQTLNGLESQNRAW